MAFDVDAIRAGYGKDDQSFVTVTTTPTAVGENFDITNVTASISGVARATTEAMSSGLITLLPTWRPKKMPLSRPLSTLSPPLPRPTQLSLPTDMQFEAEDAYNALTDAQKAEVTNADKLTAVVAAVNAFKTKSEVVLDECTEASVANWKAADSCAWQNEAVNIWWPLRARVKFAEVKNLTGIESVFIDWTALLRKLNSAEILPSRPFSAARLQIPTSTAWFLPLSTETFPLWKKLRLRSLHRLRCSLTVNGDVVAGENTFAVDLHRRC